MNEISQKLTISAILKDYDYNEIAELVKNKRVKGIIDCALNKRSDKLLFSAINRRVINNYLCKRLKKELIPSELGITINRIHIKKIKRNTLIATIDLSCKSISNIVDYALQKMQGKVEDEICSLAESAVQKIQDLFTEERIVCTIAEIINSCSDPLCAIAMKTLENKCRLHITIAEIKCYR